MEDNDILDLYWQRDPCAIQETSGKYGSFLWNIAWNILHIHGDTEECVNDTYLRAWNAIPPARPAAFRAWLGQVVRNLSLDRWKQSRAQRRGNGETELLLGELDDCVPDGRQIDAALEEHALAELISHFLKKQPAQQRLMFLRRYWYGDSIADIAARFGYSPAKVKSALFRTRKALRNALEREGVLL